MKITNVLTRIVTKRSEAPQWNPRNVWHEKNALLVFLETDSEIVGLGEAWCEGSSPVSTTELIDRDIKPMLIGEDPLYISRIWDRIFQTTVISAKRGIVSAAASAVDIALWDLAGKSAGLPVYKLLGAFDDTVFAYASGGLYGPDKSLEDLAREMTSYVELGFKAIKMKVGGAPLKTDLARVAAVRDSVGPEVQLMIDAVYNLSVADAIAMARALGPYDIHFFEAPVTSYDERGLAKVQAASTIPIAGNEIEFSRATYMRLIDSGAVAIVHLDAILCGGISEAVKIATLAAARHLPVSFHCSSSAVAMAANLQVAAAISNCHSIEHHMVHRLLFDRLPTGTLEARNSYISVPESPGLGLELRPDQV